MNAPRCVVTGNPCGTDTVVAGFECPSIEGKCVNKRHVMNDTPTHVCGLAGFNPMKGDRCEACEKCVYVSASATLTPREESVDELVERLVELADLKYQLHTVHAPAAMQAAASLLIAQRQENDRLKGFTEAIVSAWKNGSFEQQRRAVLAYRAAYQEETT